MTPLISVITPTWMRPDKLERCLQSVADQKYRRWEHIVVSDGPDAQFAPVAARWQDGKHKFAELDEHDPFIRWGVRARLHALSLAQGEVVAWLDDDNAFRPQHLDSLYWKMRAEDASWAYSQLMFQHYGAYDGYVVGIQPPTFGQLDTSSMMNLRSLHAVATWRDMGQQTIDWDLAERWCLAGERWAFLPEVTVDYYIGSLGGPRMAKWQLIVAGECDGDTLAGLGETVADALVPFGVTSSQLHSDAHNGPLPIGRPKNRSRIVKGKDDGGEK